MADWITDAVNLVLERLDRMADALDRIAAAFETDNDNADV